MGKKIKKTAYYTVIVLLAAVFLVSAVYIGKYLVESQQGKQLHNELQDLRGETLPTPTQGQAPTETGDGDQPTQPVILPEYQALYQRNNDFVGWLTIPGTNIDYPVVQPGADKDKNFYLKHNYDGKFDSHGTLYVWPSCDVNAPSDNITIYGHRMERPDGSMFYQLDKFKKQSFWKDHQQFTFDTLYERHTYQIICVFKTHSTEGYAYHLFENGNQAQFEEFVSTVKGMEFYETGVTAEYGDKLLCLSTCEYSLGNGRFVVVAKRVS